MKTIRTNLTNNASTEYSNFAYTSLGVFNGMVLGAGPSGLFKACCGEDDDGVDIDSHFVAPTTNFGTMVKKTAVHAYIGGTCDGAISLELTGDGKSVKNGPHSGTFLGSEGQQQRRVNFGLGMKFVFGRLKVANVAGSAFKIDSIMLRMAHNTHANK